MIAYLGRRLLLLGPTLLGILALNFLVVQAAPGGPVEQAIAQIRGHALDPSARIASSGSEVASAATQSFAGGGGGDVSEKYRGARGFPPELVAELERQYGFDKPPLERFGAMLGNYVTFNLGESFYQPRSVISLVLEKLPVSISLGLWSFLLVYLIAIPLGIRKAVRDGEPFDVWTSALVIVGYAIPGFLLAVLLVVLFAGGSFFDLFPLRGLVSDDWAQLSWPAKILDYFWHLALPVVSLAIGGFAGLTMLTKNSFLDEINKPYVFTARAKGLDEKSVLYGHVFRNAMLIVIAGFPAAFISIFFTGSLLIEVIFSLDGLGLLGFEAALNRDYPVLFGALYIYTLVGLLMKIAGDLTYMLIDPRIDFASRHV